MLTNYRLIWISSYVSSTSSASTAAAQQAPPGAGVPCHLPLPAVGGAEVKSGVALLKSARLKLQVRVDGASYPTPGVWGATH